MTVAGRAEAEGGRVKIAILDYGMGNHRSVEKAVQKVGADAHITDDPAEAGAAAGLIVPGVGAFPEAMRRIREREYDTLIGATLAEGRPVMGICLGMQILFESSTEHEGAWGLGLLQGRVEQLDAGGLKVPQLGWNEVRWRRSSPLIAGLPNPGYFYFANSYAARVVDDHDVLGESDYGAPFVAVVERAPLCGAQFHPEKSSTHGLQMLKNFVATCRQAAAIPDQR